jgi:hypothetical protein
MKTNVRIDNFQNLFCDTQKKMRNNEFCDVTLVSADNKRFEAHKVILAGSSIIFQNMLVDQKHPHPLIFMRGVQHEVLKAMLDLIYNGEAELEEELKDSFVKLQTELELFRNTKETLENQNNPNKRKTCKYWNKGFCKHDHCPFIHNIEDCEIHLGGQQCNEKRCHKRHRKTCRYWYHEGCDRRGRCAYLHRETYESRQKCQNISKDQNRGSRERSHSHSSEKDTANLSDEDETNNEPDILDNNDEFNEVTFSDVTNDWNKIGSKSERDRKYEQNVANLRRIAEKFNMKIDLSDL